MLKTLDKSQLNNAVSVLVGTRPGIIKMSPLIQELNDRTDVDLLLIHAGQHYSPEMDSDIFYDIGLPVPNYRVEGVSDHSLHGAQTAEMIKGIEKILINERPRCLLVCGDANTNLAGALAARKLNIEVGHVEAGLRSRDWRMPEEHNRVMIDHISEYLFAPTKECISNLVEENVVGKIVLTGNTIVDATYRNMKYANERSNILDFLGLVKGDYIVLTSHREENVDQMGVLVNLLAMIEAVIDRTKMTVIFPMHPRTRKNLLNFNLLESFEAMDRLRILPAQGYLDFLQLSLNASFIMTDSGGLQEEACVMGVPCFTLRDNTERPESVTVGANVIIGGDISKMLSEIDRLFNNSSRSWLNPYGDGSAAKQIIDTVVDGRWR